jgi:hypothetical protein
MTWTPKCNYIIPKTANPAPSSPPTAGTATAPATPDEVDDAAVALLALLARLLAALDALLEIELNSELKVELAPDARELPPAVAEDSREEPSLIRELAMDEPCEMMDDKTLLVTPGGEVVVTAEAPLATAMAMRRD